MSFTSEDIKNLNTSWPMPSIKKNIAIIGAGGIVSEAHLPAYKKAGYNVIGIYDPIMEKANKCASQFNIEKVYKNLDQVFNQKDIIFDIAVPPGVLLDIVKKIPNNSICQLQKPLGNSLEEAKEIKK